MYQHLYAYAQKPTTHESYKYILSLIKPKNPKINYKNTKAFEFTCPVCMLNKPSA